MKRGVGILIVLIVGLVGFSFLTNYTGATSYGYSGSGYPGGRFFAERSSEEFTRIEIVSPNIVNENGRYVLEQGQTVNFIIIVGKGGVRREVNLRNAVSDLRTDTIRNICKNAFDLISGEGAPGPKCFTDRKGSFRIPFDRKTGLYVITACSGNVASEKCVKNRIYSPKLLVVESGKRIRTSSFFRGTSSII